MKARMELQKARQMKRASAMNKDGFPRNFLMDFPDMARYSAQGTDFVLSFTASGHPSWSQDIANFIYSLTKENMETIYAESGDSQWLWHEKKKRRELFDSENRIVIVRNASDNHPIAFLSYRFIMDEDQDILYIYELQVSKEAQRKAIGRHLMLLAEEIAKLSGMQYVMLTVQKNNKSAYRFYTERMGYAIDESSPSRYGDIDASYEILSKCFPSKKEEKTPLV